MAKTKYQSDASLKMVVKMPAETCFASLRNIDQNRLGDYEGLSITNFGVTGEAYNFEIRLDFGRFSVPFRGTMLEDENFQTTVVTGRVLRLLNQKVLIMIALFGAGMLYGVRGFPISIQLTLIVLYVACLISIGRGYATDARRLINILEAHFWMREQIYQLQAVEFDDEP